MFKNDIEQYQNSIKLSIFFLDDTKTALEIQVSFSSSISVLSWCFNVEQTICICIYIYLYIYKTYIRE